MKPVTSRDPPTPSMAGARQLRFFLAMPVIFDPDALAVFQAMKEANRPPYNTVSPAEAREMSKAARPAVQPDPPKIASVENLKVPAPHGVIPVRIYKPLTLPKIAPALVFYHGGGWVIGD